MASNVKMQLINTYTLSFYGSALWNLFGPEVDKIYKSYNAATRIAYNVDRKTRSFLIEPLSERYHPFTLLCSRYVKFYLTNSNCKKPSIRILSKVCENDLRTRYGQNLRNITSRCQTSLTDLTVSDVKNNVRYRELPEEELFRIPILREMLDARNNNTTVDGLSRRDINDIIRYICTV